MIFFFEPHFVGVSWKRITDIDIDIVVVFVAVAVDIVVAVDFV